MGKLTEAKTRTTRSTDKDQFLNDGDGLYLRIRKSGTKTWIIRRKRSGKTQVITLGDYPEIGLRDARLKAAEFTLRKHVSSRTVAELANRYVERIVKKDQKQPRHSVGYFNRCVIPELGHRMVRDIPRTDLVEVIESYAEMRGVRAADALRSNLLRMFSYGAEIGWIENNPMSDVSRRVTGYKPVNRKRVLSDDEIRSIWSDESDNAKILRFLLLTGLRISEAQKGHQEGDRWIVPAEISKNGKAHWVHLTDTALAQFPLPACTPTNVQAWSRRWCNRNKISPRFTPHDCRRTAATRMAGNDVDPFIVERVLNHSLQGVMAIYNRAEYADERIAAAKTLEKVLLEIIDNA